MKSSLHNAFLLFLALFWLNSPAFANGKITVGATETVWISDAKLNFVGRVDTGAKTTSINALHIQATNDVVTYQLINAQGESGRLSSKIIKQATVRNAEKSELRYFVNLTISYQGRTKTILVNLNDRSQSTYKLLLGRNWLSGDYVVDVDQVDKLDILDTAETQ